LHTAALQQEGFESNTEKRELVADIIIPVCLSLSLGLPSSCLCVNTSSIVLDQVVKRTSTTTTAAVAAAAAAAA